ncbi:hypothetical protein [Caldinitratiruptor microaerophilus]|uniref:ATP-binding protein n=1 Tax=Caldinitratiruptor microaerophilus TaxID=671077 RepID=A0AA35CLQ6_9FIRM|nr:hypothetical protein [Caldinitratiruptor microaerophilus]BDG61532.1 ATP-binding protein [Caldinitratiruptor microaerophilus]
MADADTRNIEALAEDAAEVEQKPEERRSQASTLVELAERAGVELWHTPDGDGFGTFEINGHRENWPLGSRAFRRWLARRFYEEHGKAPGSQALQDAINVLEGRAQFDGPEHPVYVRIAQHGGNVYLDLADADWRAVEITPTGWRVVDTPPVRFRRSRGMLPLPAPVPGASVEELRAFVNVGSDDDWRLLVSWLVGALRPSGPYPVLILQGEQGSGKSTTARLVRRMIDPAVADLRTVPRDERDLMIAARNGWVVGYDNLSGLPVWLSDALCRVATGGGFGTRTLYENTEETIIDVQRPVIINSIDSLAERGDLRDRAVVLYLPPIPDGQRQDERTLWTRFEESHPRILGALLDAVSMALRRHATVRLERLPRMADFAIWVTAAEPALPWAEGAFLAAYGENRAEQERQAVEYDPVARAVVQLARSGGWDRTASELYDALSGMVDEQTRRSRAWPRGPNALSSRLKRLAPTLRAVGVEIGDGYIGRGNEKRKVVIIRPSMQKIDHIDPIDPKRPQTQSTSGIQAGSMLGSVAMTTDPTDPRIDPAGSVGVDVGSIGVDTSTPRNPASRADGADGVDGVDLSQTSSTAGGEAGRQPRRVVRVMP